jgi:hypothetical protein
VSWLHFDEGLIIKLLTKKSARAWSSATDSHRQALNAPTTAPEILSNNPQGRIWAIATVLLLLTLAMRLLLPVK